MKTLYDKTTKQGENEICYILILNTDIYFIIITIGGKLVIYFHLLWDWSLLLSWKG